MFVTGLPAVAISNARDYSTGCLNYTIACVHRQLNLFPGRYFRVNPSTDLPTAALPCLTSDVPPIPAAIKRRYEDFEVEEIPAYQPCGAGDHIYFTIEKAGLATMRAVNDIARALNVAPREIGVAGLKDARAVTRQMLSLEHADPKTIAALDIPRIRILSTSRHGNKLRIGHLRGNRFRIKLRGVEPERLGDLRAVCDTLSRRGVPNYFGSQRFGLRGDTGHMGLAILRNDPVAFIDMMLGLPGPHDTGPVLEARKFYEAGDFQSAAKAWPYGFRDNVRACREMARTGCKHKRAFYAVDARLKSFCVSAYQSQLFNNVLARRLDQMDAILAGDLAIKHDNGAVFRVEDPGAEAARAAAFEISPTGPIFGHRMTQPGGIMGDIEREVLAAEGLTPEDFANVRGIKLAGARRALRFAPKELAIEEGSDEFGSFVELRFALESGCYATMLLREICKDKLEEGLEETGD